MALNKERSLRVTDETNTYRLECVRIAASLAAAPGMESYKRNTAVVLEEAERLYDWIMRTNEPATLLTIKP